MASWRLYPSEPRTKVSDADRSTCTGRSVATNAEPLVKSRARSKRVSAHDLPKRPPLTVVRGSVFVIRASSFFRHSSFVISVISRVAQFRSRITCTFVYNGPQTLWHGALESDELDPSRKRAAGGMKNSLQQGSWSAGRASSTCCQVR